MHRYVKYDIYETTDDWWCFLYTLFAVIHDNKCVFIAILIVKCWCKIHVSLSGFSNMACGCLVALLQANQMHSLKIFVNWYGFQHENFPVIQTQVITANWVFDEKTARSCRLCKRLCFWRRVWRQRFRMKARVRHAWCHQAISLTNAH